MQSCRIKLENHAENKFGRQHPKIDISEIDNPRMTVKKKIKREKREIIGGS